MPATETPIADETASLLAQVATRRDETAFARLYRITHARIYAFALKRLGDTFEAADIVNDVLLEVWHTAARFEGRSRALTWMLGIAHHKILDALRRRGRWRPEPEEELAGDDPDPAAVLDAARDAERLRECLERLSDAHRAVVHLAFFEDLPYPDIAAVMDIPVGTVKTRMFHAKRLLQDCLAGTAGQD